MKIKHKFIAAALIILLSGLTLYGQSGSTAAVRLISKSRMQKAEGNVQTYLNRMAQTQTEQLRQGKFTIVLNGLSNGQYELQVYRMVVFGKKRVMSTFASLYQSGIEYSYSYDAQAQEIRQYHFICPPNSLTCWSNPHDFAILNEFDWQEKFPSKNCSQSVFTSEEYGREYLQVSCLPNRDAALSFAQHFIAYVSRSRL